MYNEIKKFKLSPPPLFKSPVFTPPPVLVCGGGVALSRAGLCLSTG